jgi:segregation and condensation protein A
MTEASSAVLQPEGLAVGPYAVKLDIFEGPLDLLLHLIRMNEVDITDIPIADIAGQYVGYLELMHELELDVAAEYLVMAATLAWIKSRMLLPVEAESDDEDGLDPRAELIARLLEYQRFKEASEELAERSRLDRDVFAAVGPAPEPTPEGEREIEVDLVLLIEAFRRVLASAEPEGSHLHEVEAESVTVHERMIAVMEVLERADAIDFERVFILENGRAPSRPVLVTTFLGLLELVRLAAIRVYQGVGEDDVPTGPIQLRRVQDAGVDWRERIAEIM